MIRTLILRGGADPDAVGRRLVEQIDRSLQEGGDRGGGPSRTWDVAPGRQIRLSRGVLSVHPPSHTTSPEGPMSHGARSTTPDSQRKGRG
jgi:hypothetical protein